MNLSDLAVVLGIGAAAATVLAAIIAPVVSHVRLSKSLEHLTSAVQKLEETIGDGLRRIEAVEKDVVQIKTYLTGKL